MQAIVKFTFCFHLKKFGKIIGDATVLKQVTSGTKIIIEQILYEEAEQFPAQDEKKGTTKQDKAKIVTDLVPVPTRQIVVKKSQTSAIIIPPQ